MMQIDILTNYGFDLSDQDTVGTIATMLPSVEDAELVLNLSGCVLDYPATGLLIDAAIERLQVASPPRRLELKSSDELRTHLVSALKELQTTIVITRFDAKS